MIHFVVPVTRLLRQRGVLLALGASSIGLLTPFFASCAESSEGTSSAIDASGIPSGEAGATADADADVDECADPAGPKCTTRPLSCAEAAFCTVPIPIAKRSLRSVWGSGKDDVWAVGGGGTILHWAGSAWTRDPYDGLETFFAVWGSSAHDVWIANCRTVVLRGKGMENGAATWQRTPELAPVFYLEYPRGYDEALMSAIWGPSADDVWVAGNNYPFGPPYPVEWTSIWRGSPSPDGGVGWKGALLGSQVNTDPLLPLAPIRGLWGTGADDVWAVGGFDGVWAEAPIGGKSYHASGEAEAGVLRWAEVDTQAKTLLRAVWGSSKNDVWAVGEYGTIRHFKAGDERWNIVSSPTERHLRSIWGSGPNDIWVVGDYGTILHFDGANWTASTATLPVGTKPHLYSVWGSGPADVWAVGEGIALHFTGPKPPTGGPK